MLNLVQILSGVALILFGVRFLRKGLDRIFGPRLSLLVQRLADHPGHAFGTGVGVGLAMPSSTSVSILVTQAFQSTRLEARRVLPLLLGADIGITALVLLVSLHIEQATPFLIVLGVFLYQLTHGPRARGVGQVLMGLAFVLMALIQIEPVGQAIGRAPDFQGLFRIAEHYPLAMATLAGIMAIALQSSTATILLVGGIGLAVSRDLSHMIVIVIGANLGIGVTRMGVAWRILEARRLAIADFAVRGLTALAGAFALAPLAGVLARAPIHFALKVALVHVGFNVAGAWVGLALGGTLTSLARWIVRPPKDASAEPFGPRYINNSSVDTPGLALGQSLREILRAAEIVREMLDDVWRSMDSADEELAMAVSHRDDQVDLLDQEIKRFLAHLAGHDLDSESAHEQMRQLRFLSEIEAIGDIVDKNLSEVVVKKIHLGMKFSADARHDLEGFFERVQQNMLIAETAFQTRDRKLAAQLLRHKEWLNRHHRNLVDRHLARLAAGADEGPEISAVHLDLLANLKRINSCLSHVAYAVLSDAASGGTDAESSTPTNEPRQAPAWLPTGRAVPGTHQT